MRESPALDISELLRQKGAAVRFHDPYMPVIRHNGFEMHGEADLDAASVTTNCVWRSEQWKQSTPIR